MRYGISPAERNNLESAYKAARDNFLDSDGERAKLDTQEKAEMHETNRTNKTRLYGKMRTRINTSTW